MAGNSFGQAFRITTAGESHGPGYVVIIDGVPPGIPLSVEDLAVDLRRRRPGQSKIVTQRDEADEAEIFSGVFEGRTTGTSLAILVKNRDQRSPVTMRTLKIYIDPVMPTIPMTPNMDFVITEEVVDRVPERRPCALLQASLRKKLLVLLLAETFLGYVLQVGDICARD